MDMESGDGEVDALMSMARAQFASSVSTSCLQKPGAGLGSADDLLAAEGKDGKEEAAEAIDFSLYKQFWGLQTFMAGDPGKGSVATPAAVAEFCGYADVVLTAFEASAFTASELAQAMHSRAQLREGAVAHTNRRLALHSTAPHANANANALSASAAAAAAAAAAADEGAAGGAEAYAGCKYLTSSQLFALQLRDPIIREQYLAQMMIHIQFVTAKLGSAPAAGVAVLADADKATLAVIEKLEKRINAILKKTPPNGASFLQSLKSLLDREQHWSAWKKKGCHPFERSKEDAEVTKVSLPVAAATTGRKRKRGEAENNGSGNGTTTIVKDFSTKINASTLQSTLATISKKIPSFDAHMEAYLEAEDPDAGIEEDYHPKNDKVYCWRARRLLAQRKLAAFEDMADGDVGKGLKKMQKLNPLAATATTTSVVVESKGEEGGATDAAVAVTVAVVEEVQA
jgi:hypothetical protein